MCTGCTMCWDFCPPRGVFRYEATWPPAIRPRHARKRFRPPVRDHHQARPRRTVITKLSKVVDPGSGPRSRASAPTSVASSQSKRRTRTRRWCGDRNCLSGAAEKTALSDGATSFSKPSQEPRPPPWKGVRHHPSPSVAELAATSGSFLTTRPLAARGAETSPKVTGFPAKPRHRGGRHAVRRSKDFRAMQSPSVAHGRSPRSKQ